MNNQASPARKGKALASIDLPVGSPRDEAFGRLRRDGRDDNGVGRMVGAFGGFPHVLAELADITGIGPHGLKGASNFGRQGPRPDLAYDYLYRLMKIYGDSTNGPDSNGRRGGC